jgi:hypothetical protein
VPTQQPQERREPVMTHQLETARIFLDDHRRGVVTCPYCGDTHALNMTRYPAPPRWESLPRALRGLWPPVSPHL